MHGFDACCLRVRRCHVTLSNAFLALSIALFRAFELRVSVLTPARKKKELNSSKGLLTWSSNYLSPSDETTESRERTGSTLSKQTIANTSIRLFIFRETAAGHDTGHRDQPNMDICDEPIQFRI